MSKCTYTYGCRVLILCLYIFRAISRLSDDKLFQGINGLVNKLKLQHLVQISSSSSLNKYFSLNSCGCNKRTSTLNAVRGETLNFHGALIRDKCSSSRVNFSHHTCVCVTYVYIHKCNVTRVCVCCVVHIYVFVLCEVVCVEIAKTKRKATYL